MKDTKDTIANELFRYVAAGYSGIWVQTWEPEDVVDDLVALTKSNGYSVYQHNGRDGLLEYKNEMWVTCLGAPTRPGGEPQPIRTLVDGLNYLQAVATQAFQANEDKPIIAALWHAHMYPEGLVDEIRTAMNTGERLRLHLVFLSHQIKPLELLRPRMAILEHELPTADQLTVIARSVASQPGDVRSETEFAAAIAAAKGMTRVEARNAFALSLATKGHICPQVVWHHKAQSLKTGNQAVRLSTEREPTGFDDVGGMAAMKNFHKKLLMSGRTPTKATPRGTMLLGVPGAGKDWYAEALGKELGWPVLHLNIGRARSKYQGETETNTVEVFRKAERMAPCILSISEVEKMFTGLESSGKTDGGAKANQIAEFLDWMQRRKELVYILASCNDLSPILETMPEFVRTGRFDRIFYLDVPDEAAQEQIWLIHARAYGLLLPYGIKPKHTMEPEEPQPTKEEILAAFKKLSLPPISVRHKWTGAEIESCCRAADLTGEPLSSPDCEPTSIADIAADRIRQSRDWAINRAYSAEVPGRYTGPINAAQQLDQAFSGTKPRAVSRGGKG